MRDSAAALSRQVSSTDKHKLDEFMTSVREVEKRVDGMRKNQEKAEDLAKLKNRPVFSMDRPAERPARGSSRAHAADVRRHRARVSDRQDARGLAAARARPLGALLSVPRRAERAPRRVARQPVGRLRAHLALPPEPARVSRHEARRDARGRRHGARQLVPDVPVEPVERQQAHQHATAGGAGGRPRRHARNRPLARLPERRRRESQDVQPVPRHHGPHGLESSTGSGDAETRLAGL